MSSFLYLMNGRDAFEIKVVMKNVKTKMGWRAIGLFIGVHFFFIFMQLYLYSLHLRYTYTYQKLQKDLDMAMHQTDLALQEWHALSDMKMVKKYAQNDLKMGLISIHRIHRLPQYDQQDS